MVLSGNCKGAIKMKQLQSFNLDVVPQRKVYLCRHHLFSLKIFI